MKNKIYIHQNKMNSKLFQYLSTLEIEKQLLFFFAGKV